MTAGKLQAKFPMVGFLILAAFLSTKSCSADELCTVESTDPESMNCNNGLVESTLLFASAAAAAAKETPVVAGLSYDFYAKSCPDYKSITQQVIEQNLKTNPLQAAGIVRIMFHDCFVQGCDGSVLLNGSNSEETVAPNQTLRPESFQLVNDIKAALEQACPNTVSCADILSLSAAEAIRQTKGPSMEVPVGRRDGNSSASNSVVFAHLPSPFNNVSQNLPDFSSIGLDYTDMVALSGAHTLGMAHCSSFSDRLRPTMDVNLDVNFGKNLSQLCPDDNSNKVHSLDSTPTAFDNKYFKELLMGDVLLKSDAALELDTNTRYLVKQYARSSRKFNSQFVLSFLKMSQLSVLIGTAGEVRQVCWAANGATSS